MFPCQLVYNFKQLYLLLLSNCSLVFLFWSRSFYLATKLEFFKTRYPFFLYHPTVLSWSYLHSRQSTNSSCTNKWIAINTFYEQIFNFSDEYITPLNYHQACDNNNFLTHGFKDKSSKLIHYQKYKSLLIKVETTTHNWEMNYRSFLNAYFFQIH